LLPGGRPRLFAANADIHAGGLLLLPPASLASNVMASFNCLRSVHNSAGIVSICMD
jgi:hypothetical protein